MIIEMNVKTHKFAVVAHRLLDGRYLYIGTCRFSQISDIKQAETNIVWRTEVAKANGCFKIEVIGVFPDRMSAVKYAAVKRTELKPETWTFSVRRRKVKCVETGKEYRSAADAAIDNGISRGAMSSHLNGYKNYGTVHGLHFVWIDIIPDVQYDALSGQGTAHFPELAQHWSERTGKPLTPAMPAPTVPAPPPVPAMPTGVVLMPGAPGYVGTYTSAQWEEAASAQWDTDHGIEN